MWANDYRILQLHEPEAEASDDRTPLAVSTVVFVLFSLFCFCIGVVSAHLLK
jgi:hypothetical protein